MVGLVVWPGASETRRGIPRATPGRIETELLHRLDGIEASISAIRSSVLARTRESAPPAATGGVDEGAASTIRTFLQGVGFQRAVEVLEAFAVRRQKDWWAASLTVAATRWRAMQEDPYWVLQASRLDEALQELRSARDGLALELWAQRHRPLFALKPAMEKTSLWEDWLRLRGTVHVAGK